MTSAYRSDIGRMIDEFHEWWTSSIAEQKREMEVIADEFAANVAANLPVGPSHREGTEPGTLKASERAYINDTGDHFEARVTVGGGTDYWMYAQAQQGGSFWANEELYIERMDRVMRDQE